MTISGLTQLEAVYYDEDGATISSDTENLIGGADTKEMLFYIPIGVDSVFPIPSNAVRFKITVTMGSSDTYYFYVNIYDSCYENPVTLMFLNKYFQWSFFTFDAINSSTYHRENSRWESVEGKRDFEIKGREKMVLTSTYILEDESLDIPDLFLSDEIYIVSTGERVVLDQSSLDIKTNQKDGVINYTFNIEKSARIFRP